jgi:hypothetical protein
MTAAEINPPGTYSATLDASLCNIGLFYDHAGSGGSVSGANISGATYFGVVVDGDAGAVSVNVTGSTIEKIGDAVQNGNQHGNAIFYMNASGDQTGNVDDSRTCNATVHSVTGTISGNTVDTYQKNGITVKCPGVSVAISGNTVTGAGETTLIAQNGIELGVGATGTISGNTVSGNEYTGTNDADSAGVLVFGGAAVGGALAINEQVTNNTLTDNDVGVDSINCGNADCTVPPKAPTKTSNIIMSNTISLMLPTSRVAAVRKAIKLESRISDVVTRSARI